MPRETPVEAVTRRLARRIDPAAPIRLPRKWELLGDVLVLRGMKAVFGVHAAEVARAYAEELGARVVLEDGGVAGELRQPRMTRLWGEGPTETTIVQDGVHYRLDASELMFSSGNLPERQRMGRIEAVGETIVDLFAGIGYFTLPLAMRSGAARVVACEKNPIALRYLRENVDRNGVAERVEVRAGDCRDVAPTGVAHRVVMGYFPHGNRFLAAALAVLRAEGGVIHYHDTARADEPAVELRAHAASAARIAGRAFAGGEVRVVKSFAPGVVHAVLDARIGPVAAPPAATARGEGARR